jgi:hypothetical protein
MFRHIARERVHGAGEAAGWKGMVAFHVLLARGDGSMSRGRSHRSPAEAPRGQMRTVISGIRQLLSRG